MRSGRKADFVLLGPCPGQQFVDLRHRPTIDEFGEDVCKIRFWIDAVQFCCFDQRSDACSVDRPLIVTGKKTISAIECNWPHRALDAVGIHFDAA
jgi:hypothetical protein